MLTLDMLPDNIITQVNELKKEIENSSKILITAHVRPDGDAIGSVAGLAKTISDKQLEIAMLDGIPERFKFVFPDINVVKDKKIHSEHDLIIVLDSGDFERTGIEFEYDASKTKVVNIDHHASNTMFGDINIVDTKASSTCEMITAIIDYCGYKLDKDTAISLMLGLITDSRFFQNEGLRHTAHLAASKLLATGVDTTPILNLLNSSRSEQDLRVQGFGLCNFKLECAGRLATLVFTQKDLKSLNATTSNIFASGIFNILTSIKQTFASAVAFENEDGRSFCEFRSRGGVNVKEVAVKLGGGGHIPASGCSQDIPIDKFSDKAFTLIKKQVESFFTDQEK